MKKIIVLLALVMTINIVFSGCSKKEEKKELNIFNWSEYMPQEIIDDFEEETGIKVNYATYSSNEEMLAKVQSSPGTYDLIVASDYMVDIMVKQNFLEEITMDNIKNIENIGSDYLDKAFDPGNKYTVPYMAGSALLAVNKSMVDIDIDSYEDLWDVSLSDSLVVLDDSRGLLGIALKKLGYSMNTTNLDELEEAKQELIALKGNIKAFDSDSPKTMLISEEVAVGFVWSAEAVLAKRENPNIEIVMPNEGLYLWQDNFAIPQGAKNKEIAEQFIDFLLRPEVSKAFSDMVPYTNPNLEAVKLLDESLKNDSGIFPPSSVYESGEYLIDMGELTPTYDAIWTEFKQH